MIWYEVLTIVLAILVAIVVNNVSMLLAFRFGYSAGRQEDLSLKLPSMDMDIINSEEPGEAPETEEEIIKDMKDSMHVITGQEIEG